MHLRNHGGVTSSREACFTQVRQITPTGNIHWQNILLCQCAAPKKKRGALLYLVPPVAKCPSSEPNKSRGPRHPACLLASTCKITRHYTWNATTEGVVRDPSVFSITRALRPSMMATHELVVPRSIPMISPAGPFEDSARRCNVDAAAHNGAGVAALQGPPRICANCR